MVEEKNRYAKTNPIRYLKWLSDQINKISIGLIVIMIGSMTIIVLAQVISRYIFKNSISWSEEIARWLMVWICFIGSGIAVKTSAHIGLSFLYDRFPGRIKVLVTFLINVCVLIFLYFCIVKSFTMASFVINQKTAAAQISMAWPYSAVPVGSVIMAIHTLVFIFENLGDLFLKSE